MSTVGAKEGQIQLWKKKKAQIFRSYQGKTVAPPSKPVIPLREHTPTNEQMRAKEPKPSMPHGRLRTHSVVQNST